jgi:hypothetical protein
MKKSLPNEKQGGMGPKWLVNTDSLAEKAKELNHSSSNEKLKEQLGDVLSVAKIFNEHLKQEDDVQTVQYYLRVYADHCFDLLALIPQNKFFNSKEALNMKELNLLMREWCKIKGYQVAVIIAPWVKNVESLHLGQDGYVLIYNNAA